MRNNVCIGVGLLLDAREAEDADPATSERQLRHPPQGVLVRPQNDLSARAMPSVPGAPQHCILVSPQTETVKVTLPSLTLINGRLVQTVNVHRRNIPLGEGFAVTDYYVQGMSFKEHCWCIDIAPPPTGGMDAASVYVPLTRYASWDDVHLWRELYPAGDAARRDAVVRAFVALTRRDSDFTTHMAWLREREAATAAQDAAAAAEAAGAATDAAAAV